MDSSKSFTKTRITFDSQGEKCVGDFYHPGGRDAVPCVVMANGFSGTRDWILPDFAEKFVSAGCAVLTFDYRHLGESEGQPRQIIEIQKQREDLLKGFEFARTIKGVDPQRLALWGTSLGGSYVAELAAENPHVAAVVLNVPALDAIKGGNLAEKIKVSQMSWAKVTFFTLQLLALAVRDNLRSKRGLSPVYAAVYGKPGKAFFTDPILAENFARVAAQSPSWRNQIAARFLLKAPRYREGTMERIRVPLLICLASQDVEVSAAFVKDKAKGARFAEIREYPVSHFEMYHGTTFEQVVADQVQFLRKHLNPA